MKKRVLLLITHSTDDPDRASAALALAVSLISMGSDLVIFFNHEGVMLAKQGVAGTIRGRNLTPAGDLFSAILEAEVPMYVCTASAEVYGVDKGSLVPGAKITTIPTLAFEMEDRETVVL